MDMFKKFSFIVVLITLCIFPATGCSAVTGQDMQTAGSVTQQYVQQVDAYQAAAEQLVTALEKTGIVDSNIVLKIEGIQQKIDTLQPQVQQIAAAVQNADYLPDDDTAVVLLKAVQAANKASTPWNPYAMPIEAILGLITLLMGIFAAKKKIDAANSEAKAAQEKAAAAEAIAKYQAHKQGVELTMKQASVSSDEAVKAMEVQLYKNIGEARASLGIK